MTAMSIVAHTHPFVVGVDTHARNHVYAILAANTGALLESREFPRDRGRDQPGHRLGRPPYRW